MNDITADVVLRGGTVLTLDGWAPGRTGRVADAVAIRGGVVCALGAAAREMIGPGTRVMELDGRTVVPGLNDTHLHLACYAMGRHGLRDASPERIGSWSGLSEVLTRDAIGPDGWIRARGWDSARMGRAPTRTDVDAALAANALSGTPAVLFDATGHELLVGSAALERCGIDARTPTPDGGAVSRAADDTPTGVFSDAATRLVLSALPVIGRDALTAVLRTALQDLARLGITSVTDPAIGPGHATLFDGSASYEALEALRRLSAQDRLTVRTQVLLLFSGTGGETARTVREGIAGAPRLAAGEERRLRIAGVKVFADGIPRSATAWHREPYGDPHTRGRLAVAGDTDQARLRELDDILGVIAEAGLQAGVHATGDAASDAVVSSLANRPATSATRPYLIHGDFLPADGMDALAAAGIGWTANPVISTAVCYLGHRLFGRERQEQRQPLASALRAGVAVTLSSDAPVVDPDWRPAIIAAVERTQIDGARRAGDPEAVTGMDALAMMTVNAARLDGAESWKGRLAPGFAADLVVLSGEWPPDEEIGALADLRTDLTMVGGRVVYEG